MTKVEKKLFHFGRGNHKLSSKQLIWSLPRGKTCIGAGSCLHWCYEIKIEKRFPNARKSRERNLAFAKSKEFVPKIIAYIRKSKKKIVRIHESGDYFSQEYFDKWRSIAEKLPNVQFYSFTKSFQLDLWTNLPKNFVVIQSYGSRYDKKIDTSKNTARVIESEKELKENEFLCPYHDKAHFKKCGETCSYCFDKIHKVKHIAFLKH